MRYLKSDSGDDYISYSKGEDTERENLKRYLREIGDVGDILKKEEEIELGKLSEQGDLEARDKLIKANLRYVVHVALKYKNRGVPLLDLIAVGNQALVRAASPDRYNWREGVKFYTYASRGIYRDIKNEIMQTSKT